MSDTPETDAAHDAEKKNSADWMNYEMGMSMPQPDITPDGWDFARKLERERDEARRIAVQYRCVWEKASDAVDICPNPDPLPWL